MKSLVAIIFVVCFCQNAVASEAAKTYLTKSNSGEWTVEFKLIKPASQLGFIRNPNGAWVNRWKPLSNDFIIEFKDQKEFVKRKDGGLFLSVHFKLEPTYTHLPKDYAPFTPFSDGGILVHDGRFFACAEECEDDIDYVWNFELNAPPMDKIIVNGIVYQSQAIWSGKNDGSYIYIGKQELINTKHVIALVDEKLPVELKNALSVTLPKMMTYFISKFGSLKSKPTLFASYEKSYAEGSGIQGGVLPNQIFMHWYGHDLSKTTYDEDSLDGIAWFFAHEAAHLYQKVSARTSNRDQAWLQEGGAEKLALEALQSLKPELLDYTKRRIKKFKQLCANGIQHINLSEATNQKKFKLHYNCGFLIHHSIDLIAKKRFPQGEGIFDIWREYQAKVKSGSKANQDTYLKIVAKYTGGNHHKLLESFIVDSKKNFELLIKSF